MRKTFVLVFLAINLFVFSQNITDFLPSNAGYFLIVRKSADNFDYLKKNTNLFYVYLEKEGLGLEEYFYSLLSAAGYSSGNVFDERKIKNAINGELLLAGKEFAIELEDIITFDPIYILEKFKTNKKDIFLVWKSKDPEELLEIIASLLEASIFKQEGDIIGELRSDSGEVYFHTGDSFLILGDTHNAVENPLKAYHGEAARMIDSEEVAAKFVKASENYWITGYFDSDRFKIGLGLEYSFTTKRTTLFVNPEGHTLTATMVQENIFLDESEKNRITGYMSTKEEALSERYFGNYLAFFPGDSVSTLRRELSHWFDESLEPYSELADLIVEFTRESQGTAEIFGSVVASPTSFALRFHMSESADIKPELQKLEEWGAKHYNSDGFEVYELKSIFEKIYFLLNGKRLVITNLSSEDYLKHLSSGKELGKNDRYTYLKDLSNAENIAEVFVNLGDIFYDLLGMKVDTALLYTESMEENGNLIHSLRVY
ncbi:hypothetical protein AT15_09345 [Kosmotoga arenicorallina S304]|uniref:DUF3352 domain-containing protein n=1 Tax=Kosmotoga arenicorallina S304 TaxID=1453497 RepID=A0A176K1Q8_9BACT|nr:hypothetical protein [Kosmotoga arenicorallina]OAA30878.1 hypothetical protein AT15_09345 [Kosmotoga arenicorallina S304]